MFFLNFNKPTIKLKRIAKNLHTKLDNYYQSINHQYDAYRKDTDLVALDNDEDHVFRQFDLTNYSSQRIAYSRFRSEADILLIELSNEKPDYIYVKILAEKLKNSLYVPIYSFDAKNEEVCERFCVSGTTLWKHPHN